MTTSHLSRRALLGAGAVGSAALAADMSGLNLLRSPALASELKSNQKRVILLWLAGGASIDCNHVEACGMPPVPCRMSRKARSKRLSAPTT